MQNRKIAFRAWDKNRKKMFVPDLINEEGEVCVAEQDGYSTYHPTPILMQFTGLLDKNGKEIYEGDLLKGIPNGMEPRSILEVFWDETMASFYVRIKNKLDGTVVWNDMLEGFTKEYTVIGNIYENPELISK